MRGVSRLLLSPYKSLRILLSPASVATTTIRTTDGYKWIENGNYSNHDRSRNNGNYNYGSFHGCNDYNRNYIYDSYDTYNYTNNS